MSVALPLDKNISPEGIASEPSLDESLGVTLSLNPVGNLQKICSFDCLYCDLGRTTIRLNQLKSEISLPSKDLVLSAATNAFKKIHASGPSIDTICISGNGEPTLHPDFNEIVRSLMEVREIWLPGKPIVVRTNGATLDSRKVIEALNLVEKRIVKIDAGNEKIFKAVNEPLSRTNLAKVLTGIKKLKNVTVQAMFMKGSVDNTKPSDIEDWIEVIAIIKPIEVHIQGVSRTPADPGIIRCDEDTLYSIASLLERRTQIKAVVFP